MVQFTKQPNTEEANMVQFTKQPYIEAVKHQKVESIRFSVLSGPEIRKAAEVQVENPSSFNLTQPIEKGVLDLRLGLPNSDKRLLGKSAFCTTCHGDFKNCPGHFGYFPLTLPVFHYGYVGFIVNILKSICKSCARILLPEKERVGLLKRMRSPAMEVIRKSPLAKEIVKKCKPVCSRCGYVNGVVKSEGNRLVIVHDRKKISEGKIGEERKERGSLWLNPIEVQALFRRMVDEDCEVLFLSDRPEKFVVTDIPVPPVVIRPNPFVDAKTSNENDVTSLLRNIIRADGTVKHELEKGIEYLPEKWNEVQNCVAAYINSDAKPIMSVMARFNDKKSPKPPKGLTQRLKGKEGRFRGSLSGKRVEYTGKAVISPDPNLKITEVAVPILMAKTLTYPEHVSRHNIEKLRQCVRNGSKKYPGENYVSDGSTSRDLNFGNRIRIANELKYGDIVERHLEDGDVVLFNRQPSLHRMSIMAHRVRVMLWRTLRFNESVCNPYNADFDGDEMNLHVSQTEEARTEALTLMGVQNNLYTPKNGEILVASTQDFLTSSFLITRKDTFYDRAAFALMCSYMGDAMDLFDLPTPTIFKPIELWTGKQIFSVLVRPHAHVRVFVNLTVKESFYDCGETMCLNDGFVYFRNSELLSGQLGKKTLGNGNKNGLFSVLLRDYKENAAASCMNRLAKLSSRWIGNHGFSIGIDDVQPGELLNQQKKTTIEKGYKKCDEFIDKFNKGKLPLEPGYDAVGTREANITGVLNNLRDDVGKVCTRELHWRNSPLIMAKCGSKGSSTNISQMVACVGQQSVGGKRAAQGFIDRTLPHFPRKSETPAAKGFVANSFYSGLTATEFFFHTMAGREGLIDTAVKTAETGYLARKIIKCLEDLSIHYDETVRNASGGVVQFLYGDDGMDPTQMEGSKGFPLDFERLYLKVKATCPPREHECLSPSEVSRLVNDRLSQQDMTPEGGCSDTFKRRLSNFLEKCVTTMRSTRKSLDLDEEKVEKNDSDLRERVAANISGITLQQLQVFLNTCITRYSQKRVEAGVAIGAIAAQSIGEPGTQMTLKTFHHAGVASMNITQGVPRLRQIIDGAKNIATPVITAKLACNNDATYARMVKGFIEKTILGEVAKNIKLVLTPTEASIVITLDTKRIHDLSLKISAYSVSHSILQTKVKPQIKPQNIKVLDDRKLKVFILVEADRSQLHFKLHSLKAALAEVVVNGISSVKHAVIKKEDKKEKKKEKRETKEETTYDLGIEYAGKHKKAECSTLLSVTGVPGVDGHKTTSNHIFEVQETLGIEAARKCIIHEILDTMDKHGITVDSRHMMLLADVMTHMGEVLGHNIYGMKKMTKSALFLASFERATDHLFDASAYGTVDKIDGVSECIIMGIPMKMGSGIVKIKQRVDDLPKLTYAPDPIMS